MGREFVNIALAADRLKVSEGRIRVWIHRHKVEGKGTRKTGRVYDFVHLADIEAEKRAEKQRRIDLRERACNMS
jgi:hypothetical protein